MFDILREMVPYVCHVEVIKEFMNSGKDFQLFCAVSCNLFSFLREKLCDCESTCRVYVLFFHLLN